MQFQLQLQDPLNIIKGKERRSKLLDPESDLYKYVDKMRTTIEQTYPGHMTERRMDLHVELIKKRETCTEQLLNQRSLAFHGCTVDVSDIRKYGNAIAIQCPNMFGHDNLHLSIAYFPKELPKDIMKTCRKCLI